MSDAQQATGSSALANVLRRSLTMRKGLRERRRLAGDWSRLAQDVRQRYQDLLDSHDARPAIELDIADDPDVYIRQFTTATEFSEKYKAFLKDLRTLEDGNQPNKTAPRIAMRDELDRLKQEFDANRLELTDPASWALDADLVPTILDPTGQIFKLLISRPDDLVKVVGTLPEDVASVQALEQFEDAFFATETGIPLAVHEAIFRRKTDILETLIHKKIEESTDPRLVHLKNIPKENYWKLLMDGREHGEDDKHLYKLSSGYMAGMMGGFKKIIETLGDDMTPEFLEELHAEMTRHVTREISQDHLTSFVLQQQGFKKKSNRWGVSRSYSDAGLSEIKEMMEQLNDLLAPFIASERAKEGSLFAQNVALVENDPTGRLAYLDQTEEVNRTDEHGNPIKVLYFRAGIPTLDAFNQSCSRELVNQIFKIYHNDIKAAASEEQKVYVIIDFCRRLLQTHPFSDANGRTINFGILNKLLIENGMPPTILHDQSYMMGKSAAELYDLIKEGQDGLMSLANPSAADERMSPGETSSPR
ncbi:HMG-box domain-containing protein [Arenibaculum pallidiluteum]|uniref:hypothetical protein n=1 Tax=Arenibaculum pallidiluteum TaxID=2812559 RepID=UPI001A969F22|nr:hypothetical protein [Arenibaculum pallidiluteum]